MPFPREDTKEKIREFKNYYYYYLSKFITFLLCSLTATKLYKETLSLFWGRDGAHLWKLEEPALPLKIKQLMKIEPQYPGIISVLNL